MECGAISAANAHAYEIPTLKFDSLPLVIDSLSLALELGVTHKTLWHFVINKKHAYRVFKIPKRSGGMREVQDPVPQLKWIQKNILRSFLEKIPVREHIGAYVLGKSCAETARKHTKKTVVIRMDIKDFFPSVRRAMIRRYLQECVGYNHQVSSLLAELMTDKNRRVPQGAPTSGAISNLIADWLFDQKIIEALKAHSADWQYTRYADDLVFSHTERQRIKDIRALLATIENILKRAGFKVNHKKTRIWGRGKRQLVLGCTVNEKVNIPRIAYLNLRALLHNVLVNGLEQEAQKFKARTGSDTDLLSYIQGQLAYCKQVNLTKYKKLRQIYEKLEKQQKKE